VEKWLRDKTIDKRFAGTDELTGTEHMLNCTLLKEYFVPENQLFVTV
jgi:hypothetical protein